MDMQQLENFCAIVEQKNFTRAAGLSHISQPALSRQIQGLEAELGCTLFDRSVKSAVVLTQEGELFLHFAKTALGQRLALRDALTDITVQRKGRVRITCPETLAHVALPPYLQRYSRENCNVDVRLLSINPGEALELLRAGEVDMALIMRSMARPGMEVHHWREGRYMLMVRKDHPLAEEQPVTLENLVKYRMILPHPKSRISSRYKFDVKMAERGLVPKICLESDSVPLRGEYARIGFGVCFLLAVEETRRLYPGEVVFLSMDHIFPPEDVVICTRERALLSESAAALLAVLLAPEENGDC